MLDFINQLVYNYSDPLKGKFKHRRRNTMENFFADVMTFIENIEKVVDAIFALVDKIMGKVDDFGADAE